MTEEIRRGRRTLRLSNLDKPFWPEEGITKGELLAYYRDVAEVLVPHLRKRPFTMKRYPDGWQGKSFFQKQAPSHMPDWIADGAVPGLDARGREAGDRLRARRRRARAALDGEHGVHRHARVGVARRPARSARLGDVRPRPVGGRDVRGGRSRSRCSSATRSTCSGSSRSRRRAARAGSTCSSRSRGATDSARCASSPGSSPARSRARTRGS